jgi:hypothetical protein
VACNDVQRWQGVGLIWAGGCTSREGVCINTNKYIPGRAVVASGYEAEPART